MTRFLLLVSLWLTTLPLFAQVSVSADGTAPNPSAMLEVKSTTGGFLPPRMTRAEMLAIPSPADGLTVFCNDCNTSGSLAVAKGGSWYTLNSTCLVPLPPSPGTSTSTSNQVTWAWNPVAGATGYRWNNVALLNSAVDVGNITSHTETGLPCNTAMNSYVWAYNECGVSNLVTLSQTTAINPPSATVGSNTFTTSSVTWNWNPSPGATGYRVGTTTVYANAVNVGNVTSWTESGLNCNQTYYRYLWAYNSCGISSYKIMNQTTGTSPAAPVMAAHAATSASVTWNWNEVPGATGYKWNSVNNYATATNLGAVTSVTESGLACNTTYFRYFWAYTACGASVVTMTSQKTGSYPEVPVAGTHVPAVTQITWNWAAVPGATGYKWNSVNNYSTATNLGNVLTRVETGLTCNTGYTRYLWAYGACGASTACLLTDTTLMSGVPASPVAGNHTNSTTQIVWNWNAVSGASGYKWNTENDFSTATDMGTATTRTETGLTCGTAYTRYVWAYTTCGVSAVTNILKSTVYCLWICGMPITDSRDGKIYSTTSLAGKCWMAQNLNVGNMNYMTAAQTKNGIIQKYCVNDVLANCTEYGGLYTWGELMDYSTASSANPSGRQGICLTGWHIPSDAEWCEMETSLDPFVSCIGEHLSGQDCGGQLKESGTAHWLAPNVGATNSTGFTGLPGGRILDTMVGGFQESGYFAATTEETAGNHWVHALYKDYQKVGHVLMTANYARSVRCVKD